MKHSMRSRSWHEVSHYGPLANQNVVDLDFKFSPPSDNPWFGTSTNLQVGVFWNYTSPQNDFVLYVSG
jgi:hypothetical protein